MNKILFRIYSKLPLKLQIYWKKIEASDIGNRMISGAFWSITGSLVSRVLLLLTSILVARILGKTEYGELGMIRSTVNMFAVFAGFGLGLTATKYVAEFKIKDKVKTGKIIGITTIFAVVTASVIAIAILISAPFLAEQTINAPHLVNEIRMGAVILFFSAINGSQTGTLAGFEAFKTIAKVNLMSGVLAVPVQIGFTLLYGLDGAVIGFGFNFFIIWILNFIAVRVESRKFKVTIQIRNSLHEWPILYKFSLPALLSGVLVGPVMWLCYTMLVNKPNGYDEMAIFDAANQWRTSILFIPAILSQIALPLFSSNARNQYQFNQILKLNVIINLIVTLFLTIMISIFSGLIMRAYGEGFEEGKTVLIILISSTIFISVNNVIGQAIAGKGKMWSGFILNLFWSAILLISTYVLLNKGYGAKGLAFATLVAYLCHTLLTTVYVIKYINKRDEVFIN